MCDVPATDERVRRLFELLDEDKSGTVECAEIGRVLEHDKEAQELSANFEALHDLAGLAEARQKRHHHHHHHQKNAAARLAAFKKLDANGDGQLDFEEFFQICAPGGGLQDRDKVRKLFDKLDTDLSGELEVEEMASALHRDHEAHDLARGYDALQELIELSAERHKPVVTLQSPFLDWTPLLVISTDRILIPAYCFVLP